jgi:hypothetical protein
MRKVEKVVTYLRILHYGSVGVRYWHLVLWANDHDHAAREENEPLPKINSRARVDRLVRRIVSKASVGCTE